MDKYRAWGFVTLSLSLFFALVVVTGIESILFLSGIVYGIVFIFHMQLEVLVPRHKNPASFFGFAVFVNGLLVEVLAYISNTARISAGKQVFLFATTNLVADLLISLPFYIVLALVFAWAVKRYQFSTLQLGVVIFIFWAICVDNFVHFIQLFGGNVLGFIMAGIMMLFTLHTPIVLFENQINEAYPNRSNHWSKYIAVFSLQALSLLVTFIIVFIKFNILGI